MNRNWILALLVAITAGAIAFGLTRRAVCRSSGSGLESLLDISCLGRQLALSEAQAGTIKAIHESLAAQLGKSCARHCGARARLGQVLSGETNGTVQTEAVLGEMCRAYEASERAALDAIRSVRAELDAGQRRAFDALLTTCLCRSCADCQAARPGSGESCGKKE